MTMMGRLMNRVYLRGEDEMKYPAAPPLKNPESATSTTRPATAVDDGGEASSAASSPASQGRQEDALLSVAACTNSDSNIDADATGGDGNESRALKVLFLSSDTGGGHRASAQSLAGQFEALFPGSSYHLVDLVELDGPAPYNTLVKAYKHLSAHPQQWKLVYSVSNTRAWEMFADVHMKSRMERSVRKRIRSYDPDVVVSVHPLMTNVPILACANISKETGRHLPIFTVCTDLGSAHAMWFANGVEKLFVASEAVRKIAAARGKVPDEKMVMSGLPIRSDFGMQASRMGERFSEAGKTYQRKVRGELGLPGFERRVDGEEEDEDHDEDEKPKVVLVIGGGEGCGALSAIVDALYLEFIERNTSALVLVVCGRNEELRKSLESRDWVGLRRRYAEARLRGADRDTCVGVLTGGPMGGCIDGAVGGKATNYLQRIMSSPTLRGGLHAGATGGEGDENGGAAAGGMFGEFGGSLAAALAGGAGYGEVVFDTYVSRKGKDGGGFVASLPGSRSSSPTSGNGFATATAAGADVEVVTECFAERRIASTSGGEALPSWDASLTPVVSGGEANYGDGVEAAAPSQDQSRFQQRSPPLVTAAFVADEASTRASKVQVVGLGFITRMAEYMVAADVLVSKAGPGTIAEAASLSLPVLLTSFLPGQEEGNVDYVVEHGFGAYVSDADPCGVAEEVLSWLADERRARKLSDCARKCGRPEAAAEIAAAIGDSALRWKSVREFSNRDSGGAGGRGDAGSAVLGGAGGAEDGGGVEGVDEVEVVRGIEGDGQRTEEQRQDNDGGGPPPEQR